jgi:phenylalanyl-tRNA synthetase beta chain
MLELGQPMHTFDYDKIKGAKMILRESAGGEKITTLDEQTRPLPEGTIIIEDGQGRIIDLCGIMGGANSEVDENTKRVLLFVQTYDPIKIRQTCQKLFFRTEAASRFEKGVDPEGVMIAMEKAITMFKQNCGATVASNLIDIYPNPPKQKRIKLDLNLVNKIIGVAIPKNEIINILKSLGFSLITNYQLPITISVPHWRHNDISIPEDLIEEIARIYGYHNLPSALPTGEIPQQANGEKFGWEEKIKDALKFWGFSETFNYSMIGEQSLAKTEINPGECLKIANPLSEDWVFMRSSLIPSLLEVITKNQAEFEKIQIFELANIYLSISDDKLPNETLMVTGVITGNSFYQTKGIVESLLAELGINNYRFELYQLRKTFYGKIFHPSRTAEVIVKNYPVGIIGEINPVILSRFGIKGKVIVFDLDFAELVKYATTTKKYSPIPQYPPIIEDLAFIVPPKTLVGGILQLIKSTSLIIQSVELIDSYKDTRTFRIIYQNPKRTLTDKEIEKIRKEIIKKVEEKFKAKLK